MIGENIGNSAVCKALDGLWQRQKSIANNIANHSTPGYKAKRVSFESALDQQIKKLTSKSKDDSKNDKYQKIRSINDTKITISSDAHTIERADGNNVNQELENIELAKTQIQYQYLIRSMTDSFGRMRYAISEGKK